MDEKFVSEYELIVRKVGDTYYLDMQETNTDFCMFFACSSNSVGGVVKQAKRFLSSLCGDYKIKTLRKTKGVKREDALKIKSLIEENRGQ